jgi:chromosome segregation ATPase
MVEHSQPSTDNAIIEQQRNDSHTQETGVPPIVVQKELRTKLEELDSALANKEKSLQQLREHPDLHEKFDQLKQQMQEATQSANAIMHLHQQQRESHQQVQQNLRQLRVKLQEEEIRHDSIQNTLSEVSQLLAQTNMSSSDRAILERKLRAAETVLQEQQQTRSSTREPTSLKAEKDRIHAIESQLS